MNKWLTLLAEIALALVIGVTLTVLLFEAAVGCGSTYVDSAGTTHSYECLFVR